MRDADGRGRRLREPLGGGVDVFALAWIRGGMGEESATVTAGPVGAIGRMPVAEALRAVRRVPGGE